MIDLDRIKELSAKGESLTEPRINTRISLVPIPQGNIIAIEVDRYPVGGHYFLSNVSLNRYRYVQKRSNEKFSEKFRNLPITRRYCQKSCAISLERYIKENICHPSRVFKKGKGGSLLLSMEVGGLREVMKRF